LVEVALTAGQMIQRYLLLHTTSSIRDIITEVKKISGEFRIRGKKLMKKFLAAKLVPYSRASNTRRGCGC